MYYEKYALNYFFKFIIIYDKRINLGKIAEVVSRQLFSKREKGKSILDIFKMSIFEISKILFEKLFKNHTCYENAHKINIYMKKYVMIKFYDFL